LLEQVKFSLFVCKTDFTFCVCVCVGGESTCGVNAVRAAGDGNATAAADRNTAADADS